MALLVACLGPRAEAATGEAALEAEWAGTWVVVGIGIFADCYHDYSVNAVGGGRVASRGARRFAAGELARVVSMELRRERADLRLDLVEPLLVPFPRGEFTLYRERSCGVELRVELPREARQDRDRLAAALATVVERHGTVEQARAAEGWNRRRRRPYPEDYQATLSAFRSWQREWAVETLPAVLEQIRDSLPRDPEVWYRDEFGAGAETGRAEAFQSCDEVAGLRVWPPLVSYSGGEEQSEPWAAGRAFALALETLKVLRKCGEPQAGTTR